MTGSPAPPAETERATQGLFSAPYDGWSQGELLRHFRERDAVAYYAVVDEEQAGREKARDVLLGQFEFNGERHVLSEPLDWLHNPSRDVEWQILLHKFYYGVGLARLYAETGNACYAERWVQLVDGWIRSTPLGFLPGDVAGRRIQNWIYAHRVFVVERPAGAVTAEFHAGFLRSIHDQIEHLLVNLAPARNHRTIELAAIFLAAVVFPELRDAKDWLRFAIDALRANAAEDFLADGVHCELSTDYHCLVLKNYLHVVKLARLNRIALPREIDDAVRGALRFAMHVHRPDGVIPALSDGDSRSYLDLLELGRTLVTCDAEALEYGATSGACGRPPRERAVVFENSGYVVIRSGWGTERPFRDEHFLVFDCGPIGAGNHGHFDALSFELAAHGGPLVVDPGRYTYDESGETNWRARFRRSHAHNTLIVDGRNQTRYEFHRDKLHRRGPAPLTELLDFATTRNFDYVRGTAHSHEYPVEHERRILFVRGDGDSGGFPSYWVVSDFMRADEEHTYDLYLHFSDAAQGRTRIERDGNTTRILAPSLVLAVADEPSVSVQIEEGFISRTYGEKVPAPIVRFSTRAACAQFHAVLVPHGRQTDPARFHVERSAGGTVLVPANAHERAPISDLLEHDAEGFRLVRRRPRGDLVFERKGSSQARAFPIEGVR